MGDPACAYLEIRDSLPVKSRTLFKETDYFYLGLRVTLKTISLWKDRRLKKNPSEIRGCNSKSLWKTLKLLKTLKDFMETGETAELLEHKTCMPEIPSLKPTATCAWVVLEGITLSLLIWIINISKNFLSAKALPFKVKRYIRCQRKKRERENLVYHRQ